MVRRGFCLKLFQQSALDLKNYVIFAGKFNDSTKRIMAQKKTNHSSLEREKTGLIELAEGRFGKDYFDRLDRLTESFLEQEEAINYTITTNYEGAFYAYAE